MQYLFGATQITILAITSTFTWKGNVLLVMVILPWYLPRKLCAKYIQTKTMKTCSNVAAGVLLGFSMNTLLTKEDTVLNSAAENASIVVYQFISLWDEDI